MPLIRALAFWSAILAYATLAVLIGAGAYPGYSHARQYISELGATGAPNGALVSLGGFLPIGVLLMFFCGLAARLEPRGALRALGFAALSIFALSYVGAAFVRCDLGCPSQPTTPSQMLHNLFGLAGYLFGPVGLMLLGVSARGWPSGRWLSPLAFICGAVALAGFLAMTGEMRGLVQRGVEGAMGAWILAYAFSIRRTA